MLNKICIAAVVVVLIIALTGVYLSFIGQKRIESGLIELSSRIDSEIKRLTERTVPYIYGGEAVGYVIKFENGIRFYVAGDTAVISDMRFIVHDFYKPHVAILPIGDFYNMGPKEAAFSAYLVNPSDFIIADHFGTYPILDQTPDEFFAELKKYNLKAKPLAFEPGEEKEILGIKVTWFGHADWRFVSPEGRVILVDPEITYNAKWPEEWKDLAKFERVDLILLTHAHFDHITVEDLLKWEEFYAPIVICPYEMGTWLGQYLTESKILAGNVGGHVDKKMFERFGIPVEKIGDIDIVSVSAEHSSSGTPPGVSPF